MPTMNDISPETAARQTLAAARQAHGELVTFRAATRGQQPPAVAALLAKHIADEHQRIHVALLVLRKLRHPAAS